MKEEFKGRPGGERPPLDQSSERYRAFEKEIFDLLRGLAKIMPLDVARSLSGLDTEQAWKLREELKEKVPGSVAESLKGLDTEQAWKLREELKEKLKDNPGGLIALLR